MDLSYLKTLDDVLEIFIENKTNHFRLSLFEIAEALRQKHNFKIWDEVESILYLLIKDGFVEQQVDFRQSDQATQHFIQRGGYANFNISAQGRLFVSMNGGYIRNHQKSTYLYNLNHEQQTFQNKQLSQMTTLTRWIAFGTMVAAIYYTFQLMNYFHLHWFFYFLK